MSTFEMSRETYGSVTTRRLGAAMVAVVPAVALMEAVYYFGGIAGTRDATPVRATLVATVVGALAAVAVWRFGRAAYGRGTGAGPIAVLAAISMLGFWLGVTFPVGVAAVLFGRAAVEAGARWAGRAALVAGVLALAVATVLCVLGAS